MLAPLVLLTLQAGTPSVPGDLGGVEETLVTAPRAQQTVTHSGALVTTVTGEELTATGERSLPRALQAATDGGVWIQETNLGGGSAFLRGLTGNRILLVVDGVRVNDGTTRLGPNQSLNNIDPATVERVEVLRGPASVVYGSDAIGGVILVWTKRRAPAGDDPAAGRFEAGAALRWDTRLDGGRGTLDASWATEDVGVFLAGSAFDFDDLRVGGDGNPTAAFTGYGGSAVFASTDVSLGERRDLRVTASVHRDLDVPRTDKLVPGFGQTAPTHELFHFTLQERRRFLAAYTDRRPTALWDRTQTRASYRTYTEERLKRGTGSTTQTSERDVTHTLGLGADLQKVLGEDKILTAGLDLEQDTVDSERTDVDTGTGVPTAADGAFAPRARYLRNGVFVQNEFLDVGGFDATLGARYSFFDFAFDAFPSVGGPPGSGEFGAFTASLQVGRDLSDATRLTSTLAQGFRAPNLDDLANNGTFAGGEELANPNLRPEESLTAEFALDTRGDTGGGWSAAGAVFFTRIDDVIGRVLTDPGDPMVPGDETYMRANVGEVDLYGFECSLRGRLGEDSPLYAVASTTLTRSEQRDPTLPGGESAVRRIPPLFGRLALELRPEEPSRFWAGLTWADLELRWADDQDDLHPQDVLDPRIDPNGTPGWAVVNLDFGGPLPAGAGDSSWSLGVHNLFDRRYRVHGSGFDAPGLGMIFGLEWRP